MMFPTGKGGGLGRRFLGILVLVALGVGAGLLLGRSHGDAQGEGPSGMPPATRPGEEVGLQLLVLRRAPWAAGRCRRRSLGKHSWDS